MYTYDEQPVAWIYAHEVSLITQKLVEEHLIPHQFVQLKSSIEKLRRDFPDAAVLAPEHLAQSQIVDIVPRVRIPPSPFRR